MGGEALPLHRLFEQGFAVSVEAQCLRISAGVIAEFE